MHRIKSSTKFNFLQTLEKKKDNYISEIGYLKRPRLIISYYFTGVYMLIMLSVSLVQVLMIRSLFNTKDTHNLKVST